MSDASGPSAKKRKATGRPPDEQIWNHFDKIQLPDEKIRTLKRNYDAKCKHCTEVISGKPYKMKDHLSHCEHASNSDRMQADAMQTSNAASSASQPAVSSPSKKITAFGVDKAKIRPAQLLAFNTLLCVAFVTCGWSFRTVENNEFKNFMAHVRPNYQLPSADQLAGTLLNSVAAAVRVRNAEWMMNDEIAFHLTLTLDGWSNDRMESIYSWNVIFPDRRVILLKSDDLSTLTHSGEQLAELIIKELERWGAHRFAAIVTDNAANMVVARDFVLKKFPKMVEVRCMMHAFSTCMGSLMGHYWSKQLIKQVQELVTGIRASHKPKAVLEKIAKRMGIKRMLITSNKTRFTSVHASIESVVRLQPALQELQQQHEDCLTPKLMEYLQDDMFFIYIKQLCKILEPFTLVIQAVQAACATLADVTRYWLFLAKVINQLPSHTVHADFKRHCCLAFNIRKAEMLSPLCKLALFLHPLHRDACTGSTALWTQLQLEAGQLWQRRGKSPEQVKQLMSTDMLKYRLHQAPYTSLPPDGDLSTLKLYWQNISKDNPQAQLPWLALFLLDIKPHAADPEKTFSLMGWIHSSRRSQLASRTTTKLAMVKMHYNSMSVVERPSKPMRDLDTIMLVEQQIAGVVTKRDADKMIAASAKGIAPAAPLAIDLTAQVASSAQAAAAAGQLPPSIEQLQEEMQDMSAFSHSEQLELANADEVLDIFSSYFEADVADAEAVAVNIAEDRIDTDLNFNAKELDVSFVPTPALSLLTQTQGDHIGSFDVRQFLAE